MEKPPAQNRLVMKNYPILFWSLGAFSLIAGLIFIFSQSDFLLGAIGLSLGIVVFLLSPVEIITIDKIQATYTIQKQIFFLKTTKEYHVKDISTIEIESSRSSKNPSSTYNEVLVLVSGQKVRLREYFSSGISGKEKKIQQLREFLNMPRLTFQKNDVSLGNTLSANYVYQPIRTGVTQGISWQLETAIYGGLTITRWVSNSILFPNHFLCLFQKPKGSIDFFGGSGLLSGLSNRIFQKMLGLYGLTSENFSGLEDVKPLSALDERFASYFAALTIEPIWAFQQLTPWVTSPLEVWAERNPVQQIQKGDEVQHGSLAVLLAPQGLYLSLLVPGTASQVENLIDLGIELAQALK